MKNISKHLVIVTPDIPGAVRHRGFMEFVSDFAPVCASVFMFMLLFAVPTSSAFGQTIREFSPSSTLRVEGESNKSDWTVYATEFSGQVRDGGPISNGRTWESVVFKVSSQKMVSRKSRIMDRLMHDALKVSEYPVISFESTSITGSIQTDSLGTIPSALVVSGNLRLAGVEKSVELKVLAAPEGEYVFHFTGSHSLSMKEYGMKPPTAVFGALHTKDRVTVKFDIVLDIADQDR